MNKSELLKGLSIEELQERDEFTAVASDPGDPIDSSFCEICSC
jgi:hypothetical protein